MDTYSLKRSDFHAYRSSGGDLATALAPLPPLPFLPFFFVFPILSLFSGLGRVNSGGRGLRSPESRPCWRNKSSEAAGDIQLKGVPQKEATENLAKETALKTSNKSENGCSNNDVDW